MKHLILAVMMIAMLALVANAVPPPAHGGYSGGWGMNPTNWQAVSGSYNSGLALYDPNGSGGGAGWIVEWTPPTYAYINYAPITLELWIEMYMIQTYAYTSYQWHRLGDDGTDIVFTISGTIQSNEALFVLMTEQAGWDPLGLEFVEHIGVGDNDNMRPLLPISWRGRYGTGLVPGGGTVLMDWTALSWSGTTPNRELVFPSQVPACDHWFEFEGTIELVYHEADGYYKTVYAGCPSPML
jgi:hypothetical protein